MGLIPNREIYPLESTTQGQTQFFTPQHSDETLLVQMLPRQVESLFVHHFQTDQLLVVRGSFVLVLLRKRCYEYIPLSEHHPTVVRIPPGIPHSGINLSSEPCTLVNAVIRHGPAHPKDYTPLKPPLPYDLHLAAAKLQALRGESLGLPPQKVLNLSP